ncbi:unnamed protein product [Lactuca virosa]|uniref:Secreted protein n=1 Tax=Lactuca virosa TaxID=75947 RepID=A0AAU9P4P4_9ASTR|nr:unnamed protein product [Lactuca virosa]
MISLGFELQWVLIVAPTVVHVFGGDAEGEKSSPDCCKSSRCSVNSFSRAEISGVAPLVSSYLLELPTIEFFKRDPFTYRLVVDFKRLWVR